MAQTIHLCAVNIVQAGIPDGQGGGAEEARMWESFDADADCFTFGTRQGPEALAARAEHHWERELRDFELSEDWARESAEDDWLAEILGDIKLNDGQNEGPVFENMSADTSSSNRQWAPYDSRTMFLLDLLGNLPRLPVSDSLMRVFLWILKETEPDGPVSEIWHGLKWRQEMDPDALSPMWDAGSGRHYYVNELAELHDGQLVIPIRWFIRHSQVHADAFLVIVNAEGIASVRDSEEIIVAANDLSKNFLELDDRLSAAWDEHAQSWGYGKKMPNPLCNIAQGDPLYTSYIDYFGDDVSGNRSKFWNKHWNAYITHRNLPRKMLQQEFHMHFILTSPHASITEQFGKFKEAVESTHTKPVQVRNGLNGQTVRFRVYVNAEPSDNPMQSETSAHIGGGGNLFCHKCDTGGTDKHKESDCGFESLFNPGTPCTKDDIVLALKQQVNTACHGVAQHVKDLQTKTGVKDAYTQHWIDNTLERARSMKKSSPSRLKESIQEELTQWVSDNWSTILTPFYTMPGFDLTKDMPIKILHTILLGLATDVNGLSIPAIRAGYILQYANSLIGRQLKTIAQTIVFHVRDLVLPLYFQLWVAVGELSALLWHSEIHNMDKYLDDLDIAIANVLDLFAEIDPSKIVQKIKIHLQTHDRYDILQFGPLVGLSTEVFESSNAVFWYCLIHSNHRAPSRDIALQLAAQESLKHCITGGYWPTDSADSPNAWTNAGLGIRDYLTNQPILQRLLGWTSHTAQIPGSALSVPLKRGQKTRPTCSLSQTKAASAGNIGSFSDSRSSQWAEGRSFVSQSKEVCTNGTWVFARSPSDNNQSVIGRVAEILIEAENSTRTLIVLEQFKVAVMRHETFKMPYLVSSFGESYLILAAKVRGYNIIQ
ncbi:uncharacterized protein PHACADRAFT_205059 [Phanerochaete carnosa HHB-10118-sp]|uniref:Uncharacterized protein n=1 Tax=Phanerochaete carnosa (strain HHB-10118-sp) TaxID=650164 RepID=K5WIA5_PHACS|nr:uncharacterized protein PHACADRAFT_205059 [Phanerochaete carnosa HHB-10118-sp]EKM58809.1 hypothetical protein PHACADRAFT_205059 [Phanerochaete carnosa HHB-10118-sp]